MLIFLQITDYIMKETFVCMFHLRTASSAGSKILHNSKNKMTSFIVKWCEPSGERL